MLHITGSNRHQTAMHLLHCTALRLSRAIVSRKTITVSAAVTANGTLTATTANRGMIEYTTATITQTDTQKLNAVLLQKEKIFLRERAMEFPEPGTE